MLNSGSDTTGPGHHLGGWMMDSGVSKSKDTQMSPSVRKESTVAVGLGKELIQNYPLEVSLLEERAR